MTLSKRCGLSHLGNFLAALDEHNGKAGEIYLYPRKGSRKEVMWVIIFSHSFGILTIKAHLLERESTRFNDLKTLCESHRFDLQQ